MSKERADIRSTALVDQARADLNSFIEAGRVAIYEIQADVDRTIQWLRNERTPHWKRVIRRREEEANRAKQNLARKQLKLSSKDGPTPDSEEKLLLRRAMARLDSAKERQRATANWLRKLEHERVLMKGYLSPIALTLEADLPQAVALLKKIGETLDEYVALSPMDLHRAVAAPASADNAKEDRDS